MKEGFHITVRMSECMLFIPSYLGNRQEIDEEKDDEQPLKKAKKTSGKYITKKFESAMTQHPGHEGVSSNSKSKKFVSHLSH